MKKNFKSIRISALAYEQLSYICKVSNMKRSRFISELIDQLFQIAGVYESLNIGYLIYGSQVAVEFSGKSRIVSGSFKSPNSESDASVSAKVMKKSKDALSHKLEKAFESDKK